MFQACFPYLFHSNQHGIGEKLEVRVALTLPQLQVEQAVALAKEMRDKLHETGCRSLVASQI